MFYESEKEQGSIRETKFSSALGEGVCRVEKVPEEVILALRAKDYSELPVQTVGKVLSQQHLSAKPLRQARFRTMREAGGDRALRAQGV